MPQQCPRPYDEDAKRAERATFAAADCTAADLSKDEEVTTTAGDCTDVSFPVVDVAVLSTLSPDVDVCCCCVRFFALARRSRSSSDNSDITDMP